MWSDVTLAVRNVLRNPGFTAVVVLTLALGIGVNAAIFSVVDTVVLRALPFPDSDRLVALTALDTQRGRESNSISYADLLVLRREAGSFAAIEGYGTGTWVLSGHDRAPRAVDMGSVTQGFFSALGVEPILGRTFTPDEHEPDRRNAVVLSHSFWQSEFGGDPGILGREIHLRARPMTVVGVMPAGFDFPFLRTMGGWVPEEHYDFVSSDPATAFEERDWNSVVAFGRLAADATLDGASVEAETVSRRLAEAFPRSNANLSIRVRPLKDVEVGALGRPLLLLLAAVGVILLIAVVNTASLFLARGTARQSEAALRTALGAGRARLARLFLTEALVYAAMGGVVGLILARAGLAGLSLMDLQAPRLETVALDGRVLAITALATLLTGLTFGLVPALRGSRVDLQQTLKDGGRGASAGRRTQGLQRTLVATEVALSTVLVASAGLLVVSFLNIVAEDPGFDADGVMTVRISLPASYMSDPDDAWKGSNEFFLRLRASVAEIPGVDGATLSYTNPLEPQTRFPTRIRIPDVLEVPRAEQPVAYLATVDPDFFDVFDIPVRNGRTFEAGDDKTTRGVVVVNETLAREHFEGGNPIGHRLEGPNFWGQAGYPDSWEIIGVVGDVRSTGLDQAPVPTMYLSFAQAPMGNMRLITRSGLAPAELAPKIRETVWSMDPAIPMDGLSTMGQLISESVAAPRVATIAVGSFAALALLLAVVGIYGVLSHMVGLRRNEFGIRQVLGADGDDIQRLVLHQGLTVVLAGLAVGVAGSLAAGRLLEAFLHGVSPWDPRTLAVVCTVLLAASILACWAPAASATRIDPAEALRSE